MLSFAHSTTLLPPIPTRTPGPVGGTGGALSLARSVPFGGKGQTDTGDQGSSLSLSLSARVDLAVTRLGEMRSWTREDAKVRVLDLHSVDKKLVHLSLPPSSPSHSLCTPFHPTHLLHPFIPPSLHHSSLLPSLPSSLPFSPPPSPILLPFPSHSCGESQRRRCCPKSRSCRPARARRRTHRDL